MLAGGSQVATYLGTFSVELSSLEDGKGSEDGILAEWGLKPAQCFRFAANRTGWEFFCLGFWTHLCISLAL